MLGQNSASSDQNDHIPPSPSAGHGFDVPDFLQAPFSVTSPFPNNSSPNHPNETQQPAPLYSTFRHSLPTNCGPGRSIDKRPSSHEIESRGSALTGPLDSYVSQPGQGDLFSRHPSHLHRQDLSVAAEPLFCVKGDGINCYCDRCSLADGNIFGTSNYASNLSTNSFGSYNLPAQDPHGTSIAGANSFSPITFDQTPSYSSSLQSGFNDSNFVPSSYMSMPAQYTTSSVPFQSLSRHPSGSYSTGLSTFSQAFPLDPLDMRNMAANTHQKNLPTGIQGTEMKGRRRRRTALTRYNNAGNSPIPESPNTLDFDVFFKAQEYLKMESKDGEALPNSKKEHLANLLGISPDNLESCIQAKLKIGPILDNLASATVNLNLPFDHVARWFLQTQSQNSTNKSMNDSAYQSHTNIPDDGNISKKKRRRIGRDDDLSKPYQCTRIDAQGPTCSYQFRNFTDWKRHEETHWPNKQWECIVEGENTAAICNVCQGGIDLVGQPPLTSHAACFGAIFRRRHCFLRKDKLADHIKAVHGCQPHIDEWFTTVNSDWKKQCGFCGSTFVDWDVRCDHVGFHFTNGKRMVPDWKDPWREDDGSPHQGPDDDGGDGGDGDGNGGGDGHDTHQAHPDQDPNSSTRKHSGGGNNNGPKGFPTENGHGATSSNANGHSRKAYSMGSNSGDPDHGHGGSRQQSRAAEKFPGTHHFSERQDCQESNDAFKFIRKLGYGTFGTVDEVEHHSTKTHFARKTIRLGRRHSLSPLAQAQREVIALRNLKHKHIVNVVASYMWEGHFSIIMYPVAEHNLSEFLLAENATSLLQLSKISTWIGCLTSAVSYMHSKSWQHLDIKPSNILISGGQVMLSDFGGALFINGSDPRHSLDHSCAVTPMYCAPEIADRTDSQFVPGASDIYSLGCVLLEIVTVMHRQSLRSFAEFRAFGTGNAAYNCNVQKVWVWIEYLSDIRTSFGLPRQDFLSIVGRMLSGDSARRPTANDILHSYLFRNSQQETKGSAEKYLVVGKSSDYYDLMVAARVWLADCVASHRTCGDTRTAFFPSRILKVGTDGDSVRLQSSVEDPYGPYVALSYCWGTETIVRTTRQTFDRMTAGIEISSLPTTIADAVRITQALGFQYLWVDSLCIIQDDSSDLALQIAQMGSIYSESSLTLCAVSNVQARSSIIPDLLGNKPDLKHSDAICSSCTNADKAFDPLCDDTATTMLLDSAWVKRAWVLQEHILARRILHFSSTQIAWECGSGWSPLDSIGRVKRSLKVLSIQNNFLDSQTNFDLGALSGQPPDDYMKIWQEIVREYSKRKLSFAQDKLVALAGIAQKIAEGSGQTYVAGLWKEHLFPTGLLWCRDFATIPLVRPKYRAPSWSWASIDSPVIWSKSLLDRDLNPRVEIIYCQVSPLLEMSPFGAISDGRLVVRGPMQRVTVTRPGSEQLLKGGNLIPLAFAQWDALDAKLEDPHCQGVNSNQRRRLWCLQTLKGLGLILTQMRVKESDLFKRSGIFWIQDKSVAESEQDCDWEVRTITLV